MSVSSFASTASDLSRAKLKRGRKPENEEVAGALDPQGSKRALFLRDDGEDHDDVFNPRVAPHNTRSKTKLPLVVELEKEMQAKRTEDLGACIREQLQTVEKIADRSKNLKGDFVKGLRVAVRKTLAAAGVLAQRTSVDANVERLERKNAELRAQMADLSTKVEKLTESIRQQASPRASAQSVAKPGASTPVTDGSDWESRIMERLGALMDKKLAEAMKAQCPSLQGTAAPANPGSCSKAPSGTNKAQAKRRAPPGPVVSLPAVQSRPPETQATPAPSTTWAVVTSKKAKKTAAERKAVKQGSKTGSTAGPSAGSKVTPKVGPMPKPTRLPSLAAITVTIPEGSEVTLAAVMAAAKSRIKLADVGVDNVRSKRAITGGLITTSVVLMCYYDTPIS